MLAGSRQNILNVYKNLLKLAKRLPENKRAESLCLIRKEFRNTSVINLVPGTDEYKQRLDELLKKAQSNISYLKMVTPKAYGEKVDNSSEFMSKQSSVRVGRVVSNWTGNNLDPDSVARHNASLKRAGFINNSHAKGIF